jgi:arylsulfatase A-like enzyme
MITASLKNNIVTMKSTFAISLVALLCAGSAAAQASSPASPKTDPAAKPNIVLILADDLGFGDTSCYGATKIRTPNVDRLAREGMRFTDAHTPASVCTPTRYGVMTGRYCWRTHLQSGVLGSNDPLLIEKGRMTMASLAKAKGYRTGAIGKWHLGYGEPPRTDWNKPLVPGPLEVGFDYHFGVPNNHNDALRAYVENHDLVGRKPGEAFRMVKGRDIPEGLAQPRVDDLVSETLITKALGFIEENHESPFFLYFTPVIPHTHITPAARFRGTSQAGLYGDYIQELDTDVGRILAALERLRIADRTLVIFSSDNGGAPKDFAAPSWPLNLASEEGDLRQKYRQAKRDARAMGHLTNGPWRDGKGNAYEGGHRVAFLARWPGRIPPGTVTDETVCLTDLLATTASLLGVPLPKDVGEDSYDILPVLLGKQTGKPIRETTILHGGNGIFAVRNGPWKFIEGKGAKAGGQHELYNLAEDPGETKNLGAEKPEIVKRLANVLEQGRSMGRTRP